MIRPPLRILHIFVSAGHNFYYRRDGKPGSHPQIDISEASLVAGKGIEGDRFFDYKTDYKGQVTFFADEVYQDLCRKFKVKDKNAGVFRRNIITSGFDLNELIGEKFEVQGIEFQGASECSPCSWMDHAFASGTFRALEGRGGLRAKVLTDGILRAAPLL